MEVVRSINSIELLRKTDELLIELLRSLSEEEWNMQTVAKKWKVKDVAAHLLDTNLRGLSISRDRYFGENASNITSYEELVDFLNRLNMAWTDAAKRLSPQILIELLKLTGKQYFDHLASLDPEADAIFPVSWAGHDRSPNWFHIAREYTEKFLHQQQIRDAAGKHGLLNNEYYIPFLDILLQALPITLRNTKAEENTAIVLHITQEIDHQWFIQFKNDHWIFSDATDRAITSTVTIPANIAWKLFSKSIRYNEAQETITISGDQELGKQVLEMVSFMA